MNNNQENEMKQIPIRTGLGFDLHRLVKNRPFLLGGVNIDHDRGPGGHSDGDPLLHAIADACLGAAGLGDIGTHFPNDDPSLKGISSDEIVRKVLEKLQKKNLRVAQLDSIILLEEPRISDYVPEIKRHLEEILSLPSDRIGVKAKSFEGLGPVGNKEAVGAWANVLLTNQ